MLSARVKFYDVLKCGYYMRGELRPSLSNLGDCLNKLGIWAKDGRRIINSTTYEADLDNDVFNTYFSDLHKNVATDEYILILWNEVQNHDGVIYGMNPNNIPGAVNMLHSGFGNTPAIPGFPSYFWFIPSLNTFAAIKFDHSVLGIQNLDLYLNGFLSNKSPYRVVDNDSKVIGFSQTGNFTDNCDKLYGKYKIISKKQDEVEQELISNIHKITRIIKKEILTYELEDDRNAINRFFSGLLDNSPDFIEQRAIKHDFPFRPTLEQLQQIFVNFRESAANSSLKNVGFVYNDGKTIMLEGTNISFGYEFDVRLQDNQIVPAALLATIVNNARRDLLRAIE